LSLEAVKKEWHRQWHKAARFISNDINAQKAALHFSGSFVLQQQIGLASLCNRRSPTFTAHKSFPQGNRC
jgi:hypothetical protein